MKTLLLILVVFMSFIKGADTMKTVEFVDLEKFMGKWFVIALVPNMIEKGQMIQKIPCLQKGFKGLTWQIEPKLKLMPLYN